MHTFEQPLQVLTMYDQLVGWRFSCTSGSSAVRELEPNNDILGIYTAASTASVLDQKIEFQSLKTNLKAYSLVVGYSLVALSENAFQNV